MEMSLFTSFEGRIGRQSWWLGLLALWVIELIVIFVLAKIFGVSLTPVMDPANSDAMGAMSGAAGGLLAIDPGGLLENLPDSGNLVGLQDVRDLNQHQRASSNSMQEGADAPLQISPTESVTVLRTSCRPRRSRSDRPMEWRGC